MLAQGHQYCRDPGNPICSGKRTRAQSKAHHAELLLLQMQASAPCAVRRALVLAVTMCARRMGSGQSWPGSPSWPQRTRARTSWLPSRMLPSSTGPPMAATFSGMMPPAINCQHKWLSQLHVILRAAHGTFRLYQKSETTNGLLSAWPASASVACHAYGTLT